MRFELIDDDTKLLSRLCNDGWELVNTFPNPYPRPYFFALVRLSSKAEETYDLKRVQEEIYNQNYDGVPF